MTDEELRQRLDEIKKSADNKDHFMIFVILILLFFLLLAKNCT